jgi:hypothetical protein
VDRAVLVRALTGQPRASELTSEQAAHVLEVAKAIGRGEKRLQADGDGWCVDEVGSDPGDTSPMTEEGGHANR